MKQYIFIIVASAFAVCTSSQQILSSNLLQDINQESRCGATIEADSGTLLVPNVGQNIEPGSICIFTIHLQSTNTFRLNITNLDVSDSGRDEDCSEAAVRIYSLTNLVPAGSGENYTFCNDSPPPQASFYLSGNLATVIYQASQNASLNSGFTLNFEGIGFQPIPVTHESSYTSATSGLIRYPVEGEYEPNRVTTWLIKTSDANPDLELDVIIQRIDMEECDANVNFSITDVCLCDALILYEVTGAGSLEEKSRLCGRSNEEILLEGLGPNIIVAFFTDHIQVPGQGNGFQVLYKPHTTPTTVPTTSTTTPQPTTTTPEPTTIPTAEPSTTTTPTTTVSTTTTTERPPPAGNYSTECGGVLTGLQGLIDYKVDEYYNRYERCLWTIRTPYRSRINFSLLESGLEDKFDNIQINTMNSQGIQDHHLFTTFNSSSITMNGTVAIVLFQSDYSNQGKGFALRFTVQEEYDNSLLYYEDQHKVVTWIEGEIPVSFPESGVYRNLELFTLTFILSEYNALNTIDMNITSLQLEVGTDGSCRDRLHVYVIRDPETAIPHFNHVYRFTPEEGICQSTDLSPGASFVRAYGIILVFATDQQGRGNGFELVAKHDHVDLLNIN